MKNLKWLSSYQKNTLIREKELLENKIMMMQLEYESATKKKEETLANARKRA